METKVKVGSITETQQAVMVTIGTIGVFFIGLAMVFALKGIIREAPEPIALTKPMMIQNVNTAELLASGNTYDFFHIKGYNGTSQPVVFGSVHYGHYYEDGVASATNLRVMITTDRAHESTLLTLDTTQGVKTVCIPDTSSDAIDEDDMANTVRNYTYYIDANGNSYHDLALRQPAGVDCASTVSRSLHPYPILGGEVFSGAPYYMQINRDSYPQLSVQNTTVITTDQFPLVIEESLMPIETYFMRPQDSEEPFNQQEGVMYLYWPNPDPYGYPYVGVNLCLPELTIDPLARLFYDNSGFPYNDVLLSDRVPCDFPVPTCTDTDASNQYTRGTVSGMDYVGREYSEQDYCVETQVIERTCVQGTDGAYATADLVFCENGCSEGACVQAPACFGCDGPKPPVCCTDLGDPDPVDGAL